MSADPIPITLEPIGAWNWRDCVKLELARGQERFIVTNTQSLAQAYAEQQMRPLGIIAGDGDQARMIGFAMTALEPPEVGSRDPSLWLHRFMIDRHYQRRGFGTRSLALVLDALADEHGPRPVHLTHHPDNRIAAAFYARFGFLPTGRHLWGDIERVKAA